MIKRQHDTVTKRRSVGRSVVEISVSVSASTLALAFILVLVLVLILVLILGRSDYINSDTVGDACRQGLKNIFSIMAVVAVEVTVERADVTVTITPLQAGHL